MAPFFAARWCAAAECLLRENVDDKKAPSSDMAGRPRATVPLSEDKLNRKIIF